MDGRQWTADADNAEVEVDCNWTKNKNFLTRAFKISIDDDSFSGMQIIGWDPAAKTIRSWTFDSNGTFAEATWEQRGGRWFIRNRGTLPDGRTATMINVMKQVDANSFTWQTIERTAGGELLPNIDEIRLSAAKFRLHSSTNNNTQHPGATMKRVLGHIVGSRDDGFGRANRNSRSRRRWWRWRRRRRWRRGGGGGGFSPSACRALAQRGAGSSAALARPSRAARGRAASWRASGASPARQVPRHRQ